MIALDDADSKTDSLPDALLEAANRLRTAVDRLKFRAPVTHVYNPLDYAWRAHEAYLRTYAGTRADVLFLGMNPGPFGMMQTGVPFGEIRAVRDWMGIDAAIASPAKQHPKRPIEGWDCPRSEVSGRRLWGLFEQRFGPASRFFAKHFVANYCPLAFLEETGRNRTPDRLPKSELESLYHLCDQHLKEIVVALRPRWIIGVGAFARNRAERVLTESPASGSFQIGQILHPSPASPAANRDWHGTATQQLIALGVWKPRP